MRTSLGENSRFDRRELIFFPIRFLKFFYLQLKKKAHDCGRSVSRDIFTHFLKNFQGGGVTHYTSVIFYTQFFGFNSQQSHFRMTYFCFLYKINGNNNYVYLSDFRVFIAYTAHVKHKKNF